MQNLKQALSLAMSGTRPYSYAATALAGCPEGGWPETEQARRQIVEYLPARSERSYTVSEFIAAAYTLDHTQRYQTAI